MLGFDDYPDIAARLDWILAGGHHDGPRPAGPPRAAAGQPGGPAGEGRRASPFPGTAGSRATGLAKGASAALKIASGCDRRCAFCAIPSFRGSYRLPARRRSGRRGALAGRQRRPRGGAGQRELQRLRQGPRRTSLEDLLVGLAEVDGLDWIRVSYLQPAEVRPALLDAMLSPRTGRALLRPARSSTRPRRCCGGCAGSATRTSFLDLLERIRAVRPGRRRPQQRHRRLPGRDGGRRRRPRRLPGGGPAGRRRRLRLLRRGGHRGRARCPARSSRDVIAERVDRLATLADEVAAQRAAERLGERVQVLVEGDRWRRCHCRKGRAPGSGDGRQRDADRRFRPTSAGKPGVG